MEEKGVRRVVATDSIHYFFQFQVALLMLRVTSKILQSRRHPNQNAIK